MARERSELFRDPRARIEYLDAVSASGFGRGYKPVTFELLDLREGQRVLDVGCGTGDDVRTMAERVGERGRVIGVDRDHELVEEARRRSLGTRGSVEFHEADALQLPFADGFFDGSRADRVFQMVEDRGALLREMIRVTRSRGCIVVSNPGGGSELDVGDAALSRRILSAPPLASRGGWSGVELPNLFKDCGLVEIEVRPYVHCWTDGVESDRVTPMEVVARGAVASGAVSETEAALWLEHVNQAMRADRFTFVHTLMIVRGTVPAAPPGSDARRDS